MAPACWGLPGSRSDMPAEPAQDRAGASRHEGGMRPVQDGTTRNGAAARAAAADGAAMAGEAHPRWHRVVLKLSGHAFAGGHELGISPDAVRHTAKDVSAAGQEGIQVAAVAR